MIVARVVAELYRIENVIYVRIRAVGESRSGPTGKLLHYRDGAVPTRRMIAHERSLEGPLAGGPDR